VSRGNPPKVFRPQRVIATLKKDARPAFALKGSVLARPEDVLEGLADYMGSRATELYLVLFIDVRNRVVGYSELSSGDVASVTVNTAGIFREALVSGAAAILTVHQHPTGDATPSSDDHHLWARLRAAGDLLGVPVLDNMVLGEGEYFSEQEKFVRKFKMPAKEGG